jgi:FdhE protein
LFKRMGDLHDSMMTKGSWEIPQRDDIVYIGRRLSTMIKSLDKIRERIAWFHKERPQYREILDLYTMILEEYVKILPQLKISVPEVSKKLVKSRRGKGLPLLGREELTLDLEAAQKLFHTISAIGQRSTAKMGDEIPRITDAAKAGELDLSALLSKHYDEPHLRHEAERCGLDKGILAFLVQASVKPFVTAQMEQLRDALDLEGWLQGECPLCGSPPQMAQLRDEEGKRYLQCSFCGCQWRWERIACPSCNNKDLNSLHYLYTEEEEAYRVDCCDQCKGYIKTVDSRKLDYEPYLDLEDIVTIHLDILAMEKGYHRFALTLWGPLPLLEGDTVGTA